MQSNTRFSKLIPFMVFLVFLGSCKKDPLCDCFKSTGSDIREDRDASPFTSIEIEDRIDLVLTQDTIERIHVVGGKNLIDEVETSISGGCLYIRNHSTCNFMRSYNRHMTVYVSVHHLNTLYYNAAGNVSGTNTLHDSLFGVEARDGSGFVNLSLSEQVIHAFIHTGPATITLSGTTPLLYMYSGGNGVIHADAIVCPQIYITQHGTGDLYTATVPNSPTSLLDEEITSVGNIYCKGHPGVLQQLRTGSGKLIFF